MVKQAIIPLAGLGTRLLPLTSVMPKELLPINGKPGLEYILDECIEAGIKEIYGAGEQYDNFKESPDYELYQQRNRRKRAVSRITDLQEKRNKVKMNQKMSAEKIQEEVDRLEAEMRKIRLKFINEMVPLFGK